MVIDNRVFIRNDLCLVPYVQVECAAFEKAEKTMKMKVVASTDEYTIYQRKDNRYAVQAADKSPINGADKIKILLEHSLIDVPVPAEPAAEEEVVEEAAAAEAGEAQEADEAPAEEAEAAAEETTEEAAEEEATDDAAEDESPAEEPAADDEEEKPEG